MPFNQYGVNTGLPEIIRMRRDDVAVVNDLYNNKLPGRIVTGKRAVPSSATNVIAGDAEGDVVVDGTYTYTLIKVSGVLKWNRIAISVGW